MSELFRPVSLTPIKLPPSLQKFSAISICGGCIGPAAIDWAGGEEKCNIDYGINPETIYNQQRFAGTFLRRNVRRMLFHDLNKEFIAAGKPPLKFGELDNATLTSSCRYISNLNPYRSPFHPDARTILDGTRLAISTGAKTIVIENVPGLLDRKMQPLRQELERIIRASKMYLHDIQVLNSSDYSVAQDRRRCIINLVRRDVGRPYFPEPIIMDKSQMYLSNLIPDIIAFTAGIRKDRHCDAAGNLLYTDYRWGSPDRVVNTITASGDERILLKGNIVRRFTIPELQMLTTAQYHNFEGLPVGILREAMGNAIMPGMLFWILKGIRENVLGMEPIQAPERFWYPIYTPETFSNQIIL